MAEIMATNSIRAMPDQPQATRFVGYAPAKTPSRGNACISCRYRRDGIVAPTFGVSRRTVTLGQLDLRFRPRRPNAAPRSAAFRNARRRMRLRAPRRNRDPVAQGHRPSGDSEGRAQRSLSLR